MGITKWPCFPAKAPWVMIHRDQFSVFLLGLSELIKGRSGLRDQFRSTLAGSGKFYTCKMKPELKMSWPLSCSFIWVCFGVLGLHAEEIWKVVRCSSFAFLRTNLAESFKTGNKAQDLNYTYHGSSRQIFKSKLANHYSTVTSDVVAHSRAITWYKS